MASSGDPAVHGGGGGGALWWPAGLAFRPGEEELFFEHLLRAPRESLVPHADVFAHHPSELPGLWRERTSQHALVKHLRLLLEGGAAQDMLCCDSDGFPCYFFLADQRASLLKGPKGTFKVERTGRRGGGCGPLAHSKERRQLPSQPQQQQQPQEYWKQQTDKQFCAGLTTSGRWTLRKAEVGGGPLPVAVQPCTSRAKTLRLPSFVINGRRGPKQRAGEGSSTVAAQGEVETEEHKDPAAAVLQAEPSRGAQPGVVLVKKTLRWHRGDRPLEWLMHELAVDVPGTSDASVALQALTDGLCHGPGWSKADEQWWGQLVWQNVSGCAGSKEAGPYVRKVLCVLSMKPPEAKTPGTPGPRSLLLPQPQTPARISPSALSGHPLPSLSPPGSSASGPIAERAKGPLVIPDCLSYQDEASTNARTRVSVRTPPTQPATPGHGGDPTAPVKAEDADLTYLVPDASLAAEPARAGASEPAETQGGEDSPGAAPGDPYVDDTLGSFKWETFDVSPNAGDVGDGDAAGPLKDASDNVASEPSNGLDTAGRRVFIQKEGWRPQPHDLGAVLQQADQHNGLDDGHNAGADGRTGPSLADSSTSGGAKSAGAYPMSSSEEEWSVHGLKRDLFSDEGQPEESHAEQPAESLLATLRESEQVPDQICPAPGLAGPGANHAGGQPLSLPVAGAAFILDAHSPNPDLDGDAGQFRPLEVAPGLFGSQGDTEVITEGGLMSLLMLGEPELGTAAHGLGCSAADAQLVGTVHGPECRAILEKRKGCDTSWRKVSLGRDGTDGTELPPSGAIRTNRGAVCSGPLGERKHQKTTLQKSSSLERHAISTWLHSGKLEHDT